MATYNMDRIKYGEDIYRLKDTVSGYVTASHTHSYLPLSGGTLTGGVTFVGRQSSVWNSSGIKFTGGCTIGENTNNDLGIYVAGTTIWLKGGSNSFGSITSSGFSGNSNTATTWQTARTLTIGNTGKSVNGSANVSWSLSEIGAASASHSHNLITTEGDYRSTATVPGDYYNNFRFRGLKSSGTVGTPSLDSYSYVLGLRGWSDESGGHAHELAFNNTGINIRQSASGTTWGAWEKLISVPVTTSSTTLCNDTYSFFYFSDYGCCLAPNITPNMAEIISGRSYTVTFDGTAYTCTASTSGSAIVLGNKAFIGGTASSEPFLYTTAYGSYESIWITSGSANANHTIKVVGNANITARLDDKYLWKSNISNGKGSYCVTAGFNNTASGFACIAQGSDNVASNFISHAEGSHTTASGSYSHTEGYYTQATERYASAIGYYSIASGALSNAEGESTTAAGYCSRTFGRDNTSNGSYSITEGRGNTTSTDFQHMFGKYGVTGAGARITGWGTSSTHKNIEKLDTSGNLRLAGDVYVGCGTDSSGGTKLALSNHTHSYLPLSGGTVSGTLQVNGPISAYRYTVDNNLPAIIIDKPGSYFVGIGADGTGNRIKFGPCSSLTGASWVEQSTFNSNEFYFQGAINTTNSFLTKRNLEIDEGSVSITGGNSAYVSFNTTFNSIPRVVVSFASSNAPTSSNNTAQLCCFSIGTSGFTVQFKNCSDSTSRTVNWIATGSTT